MMPGQPLPLGKFVNHKTLKEGWTYISIPDTGYVLGVKIVVTKVFEVNGPDGKLMKDPQGFPSYAFQSQIVQRMLSPEEWANIKRDVELD